MTHSHANKFSALWCETVATRHGDDDAAKLHYMATSQQAALEVELTSQVRDATELLLHGLVEVGRQLHRMDQARLNAIEPLDDQRLTVRIERLLSV